MWAMSITGHSISHWLPCPVPSWVPNLRWQFSFKNSDVPPWRHLVDNFMTSQRLKLEFQPALSTWFHNLLTWLATWHWHLDRRLETRLGLERSATRDSTRLESMRLANESATRSSTGAYKCNQNCRLLFIYLAEPPAQKLSRGAHDVSNCLSSVQTDFIVTSNQGSVIDNWLTNAMIPHNIIVNKWIGSMHRLRNGLTQCIWLKNELAPRIWLSSWHTKRFKMLNVDVLAFSSVKMLLTQIGRHYKLWKTR